jgi:hypothetical protein
VTNGVSPLCDPRADMADPRGREQEDRLTTYTPSDRSPSGRELKDEVGVSSYSSAHVPALCSMKDFRKVLADIGGSCIAGARVE